jgi:hypothetical protein
MTTRLLREKLSIARRWMGYDAIITAKLLQIDGRDENADYIFIVSLKFFLLRSIHSALLPGAFHFYRF